MAEISKFDELRIKTERQLLHIIYRELDAGALQAGAALRANGLPLMDGPYLKAQRAYAKASLLIPLLGEIEPDLRARLESRRARLRGMLNGLSVLVSAATPTSDSVAALAGAFWEAGGRPEGSAEDDWLRAERRLKSQDKVHAACC